MKSFGILRNYTNVVDTYMYTFTFQVATALLGPYCKIIMCANEPVVDLDGHLEGKSTIATFLPRKSSRVKRDVWRDSSTVVYRGCDSYDNSVSDVMAISHTRGSPYI